MSLNRRVRLIAVWVTFIDGWHFVRPTTPWDLPLVGDQHRPFGRVIWTLKRFFLELSGIAGLGAENQVQQSFLPVSRYS